MSHDTARTTPAIRIRRAERRDSAILARLFAEIHNLHAEAEPGVFKRIDQVTAEERIRETLRVIQPPTYAQLRALRMSRLNNPPSIPK